MVQVVPTGYDYIGGSRNCWKEGGGAAYLMITFIHHSVRKGGIIVLTKNNHFLVKFSDLGRGGGVGLDGCNRSIWRGWTIGTCGEQR